MAKECEIKSYIKDLNISERARNFLNNTHNDVFNKLKDSKSFRYKDGYLFTKKNDYNSSLVAVNNINREYGEKVASIVKYAKSPNQSIVKINTSLMLKHFEEDVRGVDFFKNDWRLYEQEEKLYQTSLSSNSQTLEEGIKWLNQVLPQANVEFNQGLIDNIAKGSYNTVEDIMKFSLEYADKGTVKHETFHNVFNKLSKSQQEKLLNEGSKRFNLPRGKSDRKVKYSKAQKDHIEYVFSSVDKINNNISKVENWFKQLKNTDTFWDKVQKDLQIPKNQINLLKESEGNTIEDKISSFVANYSYTVEINTARQKEGLVKDGTEFKIGEDYYYSDPIRNVYKIMYSVDNGGGSKDITKQEFEEARQNSKPTQYYSNLTVPGGTNYIENEISTPLITPSIKGHAQFATDNGIGWFRSDDRQKVRGKGIYTKEQADKDLKEGKISQFKYDMASSTFDKESPTETDTKTRRILEVQSDLFQKGRDKKDLIGGKIEAGVFNPETGEWDIPKDWGKEIPSNDKQNQFLQLLNKDNNWVTFFVKSIIQDSAKRGYEKVLFPTGNTASKIEGHTTLEEFKREKEDRIEELERQQRVITDSENIPKNVAVKYNNRMGTIRKINDNFIFHYLTGNDKDVNITNKEALELYNNSLPNNSIEIKQLKQELERVETEGLGALKPIYNFYENTVANTLKKQGYNPIEITDEYGNKWNEIDLTISDYMEAIKFQTPIFEYTGDLAIEEKMAEEFETSKDYNTSSILDRFYQWLKELMNNIFNNRIENLYSDINKGVYRDVQGNIYPENIITKYSTDFGDLNYIKNSEGELVMVNRNIQENFVSLQEFPLNLPQNTKDMYMFTKECF